MQSPVVFLTTNLFAVSSLFFPQSCYAIPTADEIAQKMQAVRPGILLGDAYWDLFQSSSDVQLEALKAHTNHGIAIQSGWEQIRRTIGSLPKAKNLDYIVPVDSNVLHRFLGFIEGRLHLTVPRKWETQMLLATATPGHPRSLWPRGAPYDGRPTSYHDTELGWQTAVGLRLQETDDAIIITREQDSKSFCVPKTVLEIATKRYSKFKSSFYSKKSGTYLKINLASTEDKYCFVYHGIQSDGPYPLFCMRKDSTEPLWSAEVIGYEGGGGLTGGGFFHWTEMRITDNEVLIFGVGHISMYIEAFSIFDGSCLFRFNTDFAEEEP